MIKKKSKASNERELPNKKDLVDIRLDGFEDFDEDVKHRLIISVTGFEKHGKTHFALSAPGPIAVFNFDYGLDVVGNKFKAEGKKILVSRYTKPSQIPRTTIKIEEWKELWEGIKTDYFKAIAHPQIRTVVFDTFTETYEICRMAKFGRLEQVPGHFYGMVNRELKEMIDAVKPTAKNLILLHKFRKQYKGENWIGGWEPSAFTGMQYVVRANAICGRENAEDEDNEDGEGGSGEFTLTMTDCSQNMQMCGRKWSGDLCQFKYVAADVFGESPEIWD